MLGDGDRVGDQVIHAEDSCSAAACHTTGAVPLGADKFPLLAIVLGAGGAFLLRGLAVTLAMGNLRRPAVLSAVGSCNGRGAAEGGHRNVREP